MNQLWNCVGFGLCAFDYLAVVQSYPALNQKTDAIAYSQQGGGPVATALATLGRLGGEQITFVGRVGDDMEGKFIRQALAQEGVDTCYLQAVSQTPSAQAFVWIEKNSGKRSVVLHRDSRLLTMPAEIVAEPFNSTRLLLIDGREPEAALFAAKITKAAGGQVVMDAGSLRPRMTEFFQVVDYFVCSRDFLNAFNGELKVEEAVQQIQYLGCKWVVATLGEEGAIGFDGEQIYRAMAFSVPVVDTTGAGDVYHGAFVYGLLRGWQLKQIMQFANAVAALKCRQLGGRAGIPRYDEVKSFLQEQVEKNQAEERFDF